MPSAPSPAVPPPPGEGRAEPRIAPARLPEDLPLLRALFREYVDGLGVDLAFQDVEAEVAGLPGRYAPPAGALLLARDGAGAALGCVALRPLDLPGACEMKRLYLRPPARGTGLGRALVLAAIAAARARGYERLLLDTLPSMAAARALYAGLGFRPVPPYCPNPIPGTSWLGLELRPAAG